MIATQLNGRPSTTTLNQPPVIVARSLEAFMVESWLLKNKLLAHHKCIHATP